MHPPNSFHSCACSKPVERQYIKLNIFSSVKIYCVYKQSTERSYNMRSLTRVSWLWLSCTESNLYNEAHQILKLKCFSSCLAVVFAQFHCSQVLSRERCSWSSADRRCSNYIWMISNLNAYNAVTNVRLILEVWGNLHPFTAIWLLFFLIDSEAGTRGLLGVSSKVRISKQHKSTLTRKARFGKIFWYLNIARILLH